MSSATRLGSTASKNFDVQVRKPISRSNEPMKASLQVKEIANIALPPPTSSMLTSTSCLVSFARVWLIKSRNFDRRARDGRGRSKNEEKIGESQLGRKIEKHLGPLATVGEIRFLSGLKLPRA